MKNYVVRLAVACLFLLPRAIRSQLCVLTSLAEPHNDDNLFSFPLVLQPWLHHRVWQVTRRSCGEPSPGSCAWAGRVHLIWSLRWPRDSTATLEIVSVAIKRANLMNGDMNMPRADFNTVSEIKWQEIGCSLGGGEGNWEVMCWKMCDFYYKRQEKL